MIGRGGPSPRCLLCGNASGERAELSAQGLGYLKEAQRRAVGDGQEPLARGLGRCRIPARG
jgi:hypothetical protein